VILQPSDTPLIILLKTTNNILVLLLGPVVN
jgi:hypothetical protein